MLVLEFEIIYNSIKRRDFSLNVVAIYGIGLQTVQIIRLPLAYNGPEKDSNEYNFKYGVG